MSSSFTYTFTKLRSSPFSLKRCFRSASYFEVRLSRTSLMVAPSTVTASCLPAYCCSAVGMCTCVAICARSPFDPSRNFHLFGVEPAAVLLQHPGGHRHRLGPVHLDDHVAGPRQRVVAIVIAGLRGMIRMRVIEADDRKPALPV